MLPNRGFGRFPAMDFFRCGGAKPLQLSTAVRWDRVCGRGDGGIWAFVFETGEAKSPSNPSTATAAGTPAAATSLLGVQELKGVLQQHLGYSVETSNMKQPSGLRSCCLLSKGIKRRSWASPMASLASVHSCTASKQNLLWGLQGPACGDSQKRLLQGTAAAADTHAVPPRSNSSSRRGNTSPELGEVYGPRAREEHAAAATGEGPVERPTSAAAAAAAAAAARAGGGGRPPLLSATPAAVRHIKELMRNYNEAIQQRQQQREGETPLKATGIRISLQRQGCSGMAYDVTLCTERRPHPNGASTAGSASARPAPAPMHASGALGLAGRRSKDWGEDEVVLIDDVEIRVAADAVMLLIGTQVDFVDEDVQTGFIFNNPNQKHSCGCGKSFMV
ncbi:iron-sulfur cluster assembly accessory protein, putative [Eimeria praecox]|uniref:Iron-sulfur cluster assembly accessory protein, putative n=1 Tax=Eimeria praecox TaxID=51316 RepID=U6GZZ1_9EIME|nr:iron-sulfur cluster assembly accessory protein, putative [Eimeria praecox]